MKLGMRTPSIKRSIKARTTGRVKRAVKKSVNPFYGQKGMGYLNNPGKAIYNKVYNKTSFSAFDLLTPKKNANSTLYSNADVQFSEKYTLRENGIYNIIVTMCILAGLLVFAFGSLLFVIFPESASIIRLVMFLPFAIAIIFFVKGISENNKNQQILNEISNNLGKTIDKDKFLVLKNEMASYIENIGNSIEKMLNTNDVDVFFGEQMFLEKQLHKAIEIESVFDFPNGKPSEILENIKKKYVDIINELIENLYSITAKKINSLKTAKARQNHADKFKEQFNGHLESMAQENRDKIIDLYNSISEDSLTKKEEI